jgi:hypothetical protein
MAFATLAVLTGCPGVNHQADTQSFLELWNSLKGEEDVGPIAQRFLPYYDNLVAMLPKHEYRVGWIVGQHGPFYAAAKLAPYLSSTEGARRCSVAVLVALYSHGYCQEAMDVLRDPPAGIPDSMRECTEDMLVRVGWEYEDDRGAYELLEAAFAGVRIDEWHFMDNRQRWDRLRRVARPPCGLPEERAASPDWDRIANEISIRNWWETASLCSGWSGAIALLPFMRKATGDKKALLAIIVGLYSGGLNEESVEAVVQGIAEGSPEVKRLCRRMVLVLYDMYKADTGRATWHSLGSGPGNATPRKKWSEMTRSERWEAVCARLAELGRMKHPEKTALTVPTTSRE